MGTIAQKLAAVKTAKTNLAGALQARGVTVPAKFSGYGDAVRGIVGLSPFWADMGNPRATRKPIEFRRDTSTWPATVELFTRLKKSDNLVLKDRTPLTALRDDDMAMRYDGLIHSVDSFTQVICTTFETDVGAAAFEPGFFVSRPDQYMYYVAVLKVLHSGTAADALSLLESIFEYDDEPTDWSYRWMQDGVWISTASRFPNVTDLTYASVRYVAVDGWWDGESEPEEIDVGAMFPNLTTCSTETFCAVNVLGLAGSYWSGRFIVSNVKRFSRQGTMLWGGLYTLPCAETTIVYPDLEELCEGSFTMYNYDFSSNQFDLELPSVTTVAMHAFGAAMFWPQGDGFALPSVTELGSCTLAGLTVMGNLLLENIETLGARVFCDYPEADYSSSGVMQTIYLGESVTSVDREAFLGLEIGAIETGEHVVFDGKTVEEVEALNEDAGGGWFGLQEGYVIGCDDGEIEVS